MQKHSRSVSLYDMGGGPLMFLFFGLPLLFVGFALDYLWNLVVLSLTVRAIHPVESITLGKRLYYSLIVTCIGIIITVIYYVIRLAITHEDSFTMSPSWFGTPPAAFALLPIPIVHLFLLNWIVSSSLLKLERKHALTVALVMSLCTAPWLLAIVNMG